MAKTSKSKTFDVKQSTEDVIAFVYDQLKYTNDSLNSKYIITVYEDDGAPVEKKPRKKKEVSEVEEG